MSVLYEALRKADIPMTSKNIETYRMVRWGHNNRYWLKKFDGGYVFGDFSRSLSECVFEKAYKGQSLIAAQDRMRQARREAEIEQTKAHEKASVRANEIWSNAKILSSHRYLEVKRVQSHGLRQDNEGKMIIPVYDVYGKLWSLQYIFRIINKNGKEEFIKQFMQGGRRKGCFFVIGDIEKSDQLFICEGYATGATIYECTDTPVVVAFDTSGLKPVAEIIKTKYKDKKIIICADNDQYHEDGVNPGVEKATEAAKTIGACVVKPEFKDISEKPTDFNDLCRDEGEEAVKSALLQIEEQEKPGFHLTEEGLFYVFEKSFKKIRVSNYISILAFVKEKNGDTARLVEFKDYQNRIVKTVIPPKMFSNGGDQVKVHLISRGFISSWSNLEKCKLMEYLLQSTPAKEVSVVYRTGYVDKAYVRSDIVIGDLSEELILDISVDDAAFANNDSLENWINNVSVYSRNNSRLMFCVSMAFASMLLKPCETQSGGFHLAGTSAAGKTTCLRVAASVFGTPQYLRTWRTTDNALEGIAYKRNDALLILDEISKISSKAGDVAYMFADGEGKDRMNKDCSLKETLRWKILFLSSGEVDLAAHLAEFDKRSKAGQESRFVSIPSNSISEQQGMFEDLHGFADIPELGQHLQENAEKYYGTPSIEFVKKVLEDSDIKELYKRDFKRMKTAYLPEKASSQDKRVFERFMFVGFAGELATRYGVTGWKSGESYAAALKCFNAWLKEKGGVGDLEEKQLMHQARAFFEAHVSGRFQDVDAKQEEDQEPKQEQKINNLAGYKRLVDNEIVYYVTTSAFKDEICKGFNRNYAIEVFKKKGVLTDYMQKHTPHGNKRVYVFSGKAIGEYED